MRTLDFSFLGKWGPEYFKAALWTIIISLIAVLLGTFFGVLLCLMKRSKIKPIKALAIVYIEIIRGTPLLLQIFIVYFGLNGFGIKLDAMTACVVALSMNSGAYVAELIRAGIEAVDKGQIEAARSLGMSQSMAMRLIVAPQAIKNILPAIGNEFVAIIKESSMASTIGIAELMHQSKMITGATYRSFEPLMVAAVFYFVMTFSLGRLMAYIERRLNTDDRG